ncbi:MAG: AbrB/MazE/SpoVT family DNA-binding domain-containing protein [Candidatus Bathyarchaeia archaeon]
MAKSRVDRYGRVLIPKEVRRKLGLDSGEPVELRIRGRELILRRFDKELDERVRDWADGLRRASPGAFITEARGGDSKWLSREYCLRKLGL